MSSSITDKIYLLHKLACQFNVTNNGQPLAIKEVATLYLNNPGKKFYFWQDNDVHDNFENGYGGNSYGQEKKIGTDKCGMDEEDDRWCCIDFNQKEVKIDEFDSLKRRIVIAQSPHLFAAEMNAPLARVRIRGVKGDDYFITYSSYDRIDDTDLEQHSTEILLCILDEISKTTFDLHGGFGKVTKDSSFRFPNGVANIYDIIFDALRAPEVKSNAFLPVMQRIRAILDQKITKNQGLFLGYGARDNSVTSPFYQKLKNLITPYISKNVDDLNSHAELAKIEQSSRFIK